jgi:hypothetical protein
MKKFFLTSAFMLIFSLIINAQEKIYMPYFEVINMNKDYQDATTRLLKTYLEANNKAHLILPNKDSIIYSETKEQALINAKSLNINHVLIGELNRVGETVVISVTLFKTENGDQEWTTIQRAISPDDLDPIMQKVALSLINRNSIANSEDIYNVTNYDAKQLNKMSANTYYGIEIGGGVAFLNAKNKLPTGFGVVYSGDLRNLILDVKGSLLFSDVNIYNLSVHVNYPLINKVASPYLSGGLGYGGVTVKEASQTYRGNGLTFYGGGGYIVNRTSNINLRVDANLFLSAYEVNNTYPSGVLLGIMLLF